MAGAIDWRSVAEFDLPEYEECFCGHDGSGGVEPYATVGWFRKNSISGDGFRTGAGEWLFPEPTHFAKLDLPPPPPRGA
jgi:hypothetical protein